MKKFVAIILSFSMFFSLTTCVFAEDACKKSKRVYELSFELNKPVEIFKSVKAEENFDIDYVINEFSKVKLTTCVTSEMKNEFEGKLYIKSNSNMPISISEDLKFTADTTSHSWIEYKFSNMEEASLLLVQKDVVEEKYSYLDVFAIEGLEEISNLKDAVSVALNSNLWDEDKPALLLKSLLEGNAKIVHENEVTTVTFTEAGLINGVIDSAINLGIAELKTVYENGDIATGFSEADIQFVKETVKSLDLFSDEDALTVILNKNVCEIKLHLDFNMFSLLKAMGESEEYLYPLAEENSNVDVTVKLKITENEFLGNVQMPLLTEDNSLDCGDMIKLMLDQNANHSSENIYQPEFITDSGDAVYDRGGMYIKAEDLNYDVYDCLTVNSSCDKRTGDVNVTITSDYMEPIVIKGNFDKDGCTVNGNEMWMRKPFSYKDEFNWETYDSDRHVYINTELLKSFDCKVKSMTISYVDYNGEEYETPRCSVTIMRPNKAFVNNESANYNVGIIGGTDGPTKVFVTE